MDPKIENLSNIGEFSNKYRAVEKTKQLIQKHATEAGENILKLNNTKTDGVDKKDNGFVLLYKVGNKTFMVNEGTMGKQFVESIDYRNILIGEAKKVEVKLKTDLLTSLLKSQYGNTTEYDTPREHKRKNYKGIGAENKKRKTNTANKDKSCDEEIYDNNSDINSDSIINLEMPTNSKSIARKRNTKSTVNHSTPKKQRSITKEIKGKISNQNSDINKETSVSSTSTEINKSEWLNSLLRKETAPTPQKKHIVSSQLRRQDSYILLNVQNVVLSIRPGSLY